MTKKSTLYVIGIVFLWACVLLGYSSQALAARGSAPAVSIDPSSGKVKTKVTISGSGVKPAEEVDILMIVGEGMKIGMGTRKVEVIKADGGGNFSVRSAIYSKAKPGTYTIEVSGNMGSEATTSLTVLKKN